MFSVTEFLSHYLNTRPLARADTRPKLAETKGITDEEISFIEKVVRPMDLDLFGGIADE